LITFEQLSYIINEIDTLLIENQRLNREIERLIELNKRQAHDILCKYEKIHSLNKKFLYSLEN